MPSWLCIQDPSSCLRSLALPAILSPSWSAPQLFFRPGLPSAAPAPPSHRLSGALLPLENSALTPPLAHPLPCSPLIEMLMRLLWLPALPGGRAPWPGRCTCQVRGRLGCQIQLERNQSQSSHNLGVGSGRRPRPPDPAVLGTTRESGHSLRRGRETQERARLRGGKTRAREAGSESLATRKEAGKEEDSWGETHREATGRERPTAKTQVLEEEGRR